ncbi:MAG: hypothetical protein NC099_04685 [Corallococcus sp.]|nr:hypothetical protein [Corallococcus sp.]
MSDQIQETPQVEAQQPAAPAPEKAKKDNWFLKIWRNKTKRNVFMIACCLVLILFATMVSSLVQTDGWTASVEDLRGATNSGTKMIAAVDDDPESAAVSRRVSGYVASGLLYIPKNATKETPAPGIVFTHGLYNNREMQLQNVIEMVRRGFVVLTIDHNEHGHNTDTNVGDFDGSIFVSAAKYLYNLDCVDKTKIGISGHSMGGSATANALALDGITAGSQIAANHAAGTHMGIISAGLVQANSAPTSIGSNVIAAGVVKASSDEFFFGSMGFGCTLKENQYVAVNKNSVTESNYTNYYLKKGNEYVKQTENDKYSSSKQYYNLTTRGNSTWYLQSREALVFTRGIAAAQAAAVEDWTTKNGAIYVAGGGLDPIATPTKYNKSNVPARNTLVSVQNKGKAIASATQSIRVVYEAKETHPMNHFSVVSAGHVIDFFYNAFGTPEGAHYISPVGQSWWLKEAVSLLGFLGLFGLLFPVLDMLLGTRLFASLKAKEGEVTEGPVLLTRPRKHVSYWIPGILTAIFSAISLKHVYGSDTWEVAKQLKSMMGDTSTYIYNDTVAGFATWGIMCGVFALVVTLVVWCINRCINIFKYGDEASLYDERPLEGFKIRSWQNVLKTPLLAAILLAIFYGVMFGIWGMATVDFRIWTFDLRVFDLIRIPAMLQYVPFFFIFYMITSVLSQNYRVKDLPEWATIAINVVFNVIGVLILLWASNDYFIRTGAQTVGYTLNLFYIAAIPIIPCVAIATVIARRMYVRTGNAWLAGIVNAVIMTFIACANTSIVAQPSWVLGA